MPIKPELKEINLKVSPDKIMNPVLNQMADNDSELEAKLTSTTLSGRIEPYDGKNQLQVLSDMRAIGSIIDGNPTYRNAFMSAVWNRIGEIVIRNRMWLNPWRGFKKGILQLGETIEEIFVELAKPYEYDPEEAEVTVFKREIPDIRAWFHVLNYQKRYKQTIQRATMQQAFISWNGLELLVEAIIGVMRKSAEYDEFLVMKYLFARLNLDGFINSQVMPAVTAENSNEIITLIKKVSNDWEFLSTDFNYAGVHESCPKEFQNIIMDDLLDAVVDVNSLASAYNLDYRQFLGKRVLVDSFSKFDLVRLGELFANDPWYTPFTSEELDKLSQIHAMIVDDQFPMIYDVLEEMDDIRNPQGLYFNYNYHTWKIVSASPYKLATTFYVGDEPAVTSVAVNPSAATLNVGAGMQFTTTVEVVGFAGKSVIWRLDGNTSSATTVRSGYVQVSRHEKASTLILTAISTVDNTVIGTATISLVGQLGGSVTSVVVNPTTASLSPGQALQFNAVVQGTGDFDSSVTWSVTGGTAGTDISSGGLLTLAPVEPAVTLTVTATSNMDLSKKAEATVTVVQPTQEDSE